MVISRSMLSETVDAAEQNGVDSIAAFRLLAERAWTGQQALAEAIERLSLTLQNHLPVGAPPEFGAYVAEAAAPRSGITVRCLGGFQLLVGGIPIDIWRSARARALFQFLVSHRGHPVTRNAVIEALWPDPEALPASTSLKVVVHRLRKALGGMGADGPIDVQAGEDGYQLTATGMWVDVEQFERSLLRARQLEGAGQAAAAVVEYACAADLYQGDFLLDVVDEWAVLRRERLKDQYLHSLERLTDAALAAGDYDACIDRCQLILEHDHCREDAYRALMVSHARLGQRGRASRWYEVCVDTLRSNLDVEPEPETQLTYRRAVAGEFSPRSGTSATRVTAS